MTTHRAIQIHQIQDYAESRAQVCRRAASNAARINNDKAAGHFLRKAARLDRVAALCAMRLRHA